MFLWLFLGFLYTSMGLSPNHSFLDGNFAKTIHYIISYPFLGTSMTSRKPPCVAIDGTPDLQGLPSGKLILCHGKSPFFMGKSTISMAIFHCFLYVHQRVNPLRSPLNHHKNTIFLVVKSPFSYGFYQAGSNLHIMFNSFLYVYQRVNLHFPMVFLWFSYGFPIFLVGFVATRHFPLLQDEVGQIAGEGRHTWSSLGSQWDESTVKSMGFFMGH